MKVKITCGGYGYVAPGSKSVRLAYMGDVVDVPEAEAMRLFKRGAAVPVEDVTPKAVATPAEGSDDSAASVNMIGSSDAPEGNSEAHGEDGADGIDEDAAGHLDAEQLSSMTIADLKKLAGDMGVDVSKCKVKADYVAAIAAAEVEPGPTIDAQGPVL